MPRRLPCDTAGRCGEALALPARGRGGGLLQRLLRPCSDAGRCGVANALAALGRLWQWLLQTCGTEFIVSGAAAKLTDFEYR